MKKPMNGENSLLNMFQSQKRELEYNEKQFYVLFLHIHDTKNNKKLMKLYNEKCIVVIIFP